MNICPDGCDALIDTGTTLMTFETMYYNLISEKLGMRYLNCESIDSLPNIEFQFDGFSYVLTPDQYVL